MLTRERDARWRASVDVARSARCYYACYVLFAMPFDVHAAILYYYFCSFYDADATISMILPAIDDDDDCFSCLMLFDA